VNAFSLIRTLSARADSVETVYLPNSNTEATAFFLHDTMLGSGDVFNASLIGLQIDDEQLDTDEAVKRFGLDQVTPGKGRRSPMHGNATNRLHQAWPVWPVPCGEERRTALGSRPTGAGDDRS